MISYELPLNEVILDFYDKLKSKTQGYASLDYELLGYRESDLVRLDILSMASRSMRCRSSRIRIVLTSEAVRSPKK